MPVDWEDCDDEEDESNCDSARILGKDDLSFISSDDLIIELLSRTTFRGLIIRQMGDFKGLDQTDWRWDSKNLDNVAEFLKNFANIM